MLYEAPEILREQVAIYINDYGLVSDKVSLDSIAHFIDNLNKENQELDN
ncbi:hypothetical protein ACFSYG_17280 [Leeuwenhoekiella polynyae]|uniref:Uncharacterized protein n=1 Tax=Leeuwenhoekiella polynyae TaxID=1550906 RepID=A0A4Q0P7J1_9FLAO|nr:hypothetical protein [Leeuwenhoekiella polynyae]RXG22238.1 hypothetical protein DSM02_1837 [Leeuwenhoekiella polynyae]